MKINKNSLQARIKNLSSQKGVPSNVILQDYFFDAFNKTFVNVKNFQNRQKCSNLYNLNHGGSYMINNKYLEEFKIDLVKQYMQGKQKKEICKEYGIAKSTMWGWICKYASLIDNSWKVEDIKNVEEEYVDITAPLVKEYKEQNIINTTNETVRIFKNGYTILCHISKLDKVMRIIKND